MTEKKKYSRNLARAVALELIEYLGSGCERIEVAGSIRRGKPMVGDVELIYAPKLTNPRSTTVKKKLTWIWDNKADEVIEALIKEGILAKRPKSNGTLTYGEKNKLMIHVDTGIPVDLFATTQDAWFSTLVCRTGSGDHNIKLASSAKKLGRAWHVYGDGVDVDGVTVKATSEEHLFELCGVPFLQPNERN